MLLLISSLIAWAGPHAEHSLSHPGADLEPGETWRESPTQGPDVWVYGYLPYWADDLNLAWDRLSHVAIFDVGLESDGSLSNTSRWTSIAADAVARARPYGVRIHLTVTSFSDTVMDSVLPSPSRRAKAITELERLVEDYGAHGVSVDFEGMDRSNKEHLVDFVAELDAAVDEVTLATPSVDWSGAYDYDELAAHAVLFIMGYGYHWSGGDPGPVAPLRGGDLWGKYALDWTVDDHMTWGAPADRIVLGLPLYGRDWPSSSTAVPGSATADGVAVVYTDAIERGDRYGRNWDAASDTAYTFPDSKSQLWYDDLEAIRIKTAYAVDQGLKGIGFWALNYEGGDPVFWDMIGAETTLPGRDPGGEDPGPADTGEPSSTDDTGRATDSPTPDTPDTGEPPSPPASDPWTRIPLEDAGMSCTTAPRYPLSWLALAPLLALTRRRRTSCPRLPVRLATILSPRPTRARRRGL